MYKALKTFSKDFENELQIYVNLFTVLYADDTEYCWQSLVKKHLALKINHSPTQTHTVGTLQHQLF